MYPNYPWDSAEEEGRYTYGQSQPEAPGWHIPLAPGSVPEEFPGWYTAYNPPPAGSAPPGTNWMLNPNTGSFDAIPIGQMPPWGPIASQPGLPTPTAAPAPSYETIPMSGGGGYEPQGGGGGGFDPSGFSWPQFSAPSFSAPAPFSYDAFKAPDFGEVFNDPSYKGRRDEGLQAIEHGAAAKGLTRLPQTLKALGAWNQDFASREYGNIFDRSANTWSMNRNNAADNYATNYGISRDVFDRDYQGSRDMFDMNQFQPAKLTFDDMYRRWRDELDSTTQIATGGYD